MGEFSDCFKLATCDTQTENQNITAYGILVSVSSSNSFPHETKIVKSRKASLTDSVIGEYRLG